MDSKKDEQLKIESTATVPLAYHEVHMQRMARIIKYLIIGWAVSIMFSTGCAAYERLQYDYESTIETTGVYVVSDSEGNIIASDLSPEDVIRIFATAQNLHNTDNQNQD